MTTKHQVFSFGWFLITLDSPGIVGFSNDMRVSVQYVTTNSDFENNDQTVWVRCQTLVLLDQTGLSEHELAPTKPPKSSRRSFTFASLPNMRNESTGDIVPLFPDSNEMVHNDFFCDPSFGRPRLFQEDLTAMQTNLKDILRCVKELNQRGGGN